MTFSSASNVGKVSKSEMKRVASSTAKPMRTGWVARIGLEKNEAR